MGTATSTTKNQPKVVIRLGGIGVSAALKQDLKDGNSCFRASNGDWYKVICEGSGSEDVRIINSKHLFMSSQPPLIEKIQFLPIGTDISPRDRAALVLPVIFSTKHRFIHLDIGDVIKTIPEGTTTEQSFVVTDVEPAGGGIITPQHAEVFVEGDPIEMATKLRFSPAFGVAQELDRERFRSYLARRGASLYLQLNEPIQDDFSKQWIVMEMDTKHSRAVLSPSAYVSIGWNPEVKPVTECGHCFRAVSSPTPDFSEFAFACPECGFLVPNPTYSAWIQADRATTGPAKQLLNRLKEALSDISANDPRTIVLGSLISRLPQQIDGTLDWHALDEVAVRVLQSPTQPILNSTPPEVLSRLPISTYVSYGSDSNERCEICLELYVSNLSLVRTLPCFHRFHVTCSDNWLSLSKACPLCKTEVDASEDDLMMLRD